jgi:ABC-type nitrate/sulfonate/bicarbonate transport system permease component
MLIGFALFLGFWYLAVEVWKLPRFREMPGITTVIKEWLSREPTYGLSIYTDEYYKHIWVSVWRVTQAFFLATLLGVPIGLFSDGRRSSRNTSSRSSRCSGRFPSSPGFRSRSSCSSPPSRR